MQERVESGLVQTYIEHQPIERFVINTHAFHNAHLLRAALPRSLVAPILLHPDRQAKHFEIAGGLRVTQEAKRKARAAQKKEEVINPASSTGPGPHKRKRLETEEENLDGAVMVYYCRPTPLSSPPVVTSSIDVVSFAPRIVETIA
jgi:hypothetical protein